jgi:hypothetical protein
MKKKKMLLVEDENLNFSCGKNADRVVKKDSGELKKLPIVEETSDDYEVVKRIERKNDK